MRSARIELILDTLKAVRGAKDLSKAADDLADNLGDTARQGDRAGRAIDDAGDQMSQAARAAVLLDHEIDKLSGSLREMAISQALTGESFAKQIRSQQSEFSRLTRSRKLLGDAGDDAAGNFMKRFTTSLGTSFASAGTSAPLLVGAGVLGAALAPTIGAAIGAGIAGGVGAAAILGGIALIAKDPLVATYGKQIGQRLSAGLAAEAQVFKKPVLESLAALDDAAQQSLPKIGKVFEQQAPQVQGFTASITRAGEALLDSFVVASGRSAPALGALGHMVEAVGASVGGFIDDVTANSSAGASALNDLTDAMTSTIQNTGTFIHGLADIKSGLDGFDHGIDVGRNSIEDFFTAASGGRVAFDITADGYTHGTEAAKLYSKGVIGVSGSVNDYKAYQKAATAATVEFTGVQTVAAVTADNVAAAQKHLTDVQGALTAGLGSLGGATSVAGQRSAALKTAMDNLYGAAIRNTDANEAYQASVDALSGSVKSNGRSLNINTVAGRTNRDALEALLTSSGELYVSNIAAGVSIGQATTKHQNRIAAIKEESKRLGLNTGKTQELINTYGQIPKKKTTDLIVGKLGDVVTALKDLYLFQRALADGIPIASERGKLNKPGPDKRFGGYASGGYTGAGAKHEPAGIVHRDEFVVRKEARRSVERQAPGFLNELNATGQMPGYARGGTVAPIDTSTRWPFRTNLAGTKVMSRAEASSKVMPSFGNWPSSPGAQRGDSGVWRSIVALIKSTGFGGSFGNAYRPGDPLWHGSGRAVDWMGFNQDPLASFLAARRPLELIHRTSKRDYAYTRGVNKGSFNEGLMNAHRNHVHIAMANGGMLREPVFGYGMRSGNSYSLAERGPERVLSAAQTARGGGGNTYVTVQAGYIVTPQQLENKLTEVVGNLQRKSRVR